MTARVANDDEVLRAALHVLVDNLDGAGLRRLLSLTVSGTTASASVAPDTGGRTLADALDRFEREYLGPDVRPSTREWRTLACRRLREWYGPRDVGDVGRAEGVDIYNRLSKSTASLTCATLARVLKLAHGWGWRPTMHDLGKLGHVQAKPRERVLSHEEIAAILGALEAMEGEPGRRSLAGLAVIRTILFTGLRVSEVCGMQWRHVDADCSHVFLPETKNGEPRTASMPPEVQAVLRARRDAADRSERWCFRGRKGKAINRRAVLHLMKQVGERAGVELDGLHLHLCRHTFATEGFRQGVQSRIVQEALGWRSEAMLRRYQHVRSDEVREGVDTIAAAIAGTPKGE